MAMRPLLLAMALVVATCAGETAVETTTATVGTTATSAETTTTPTPTSTEPSGPKTVDVSIENFKFSPASITVRVGDTLRWTVTSGTHTTTSNTGAWDSKSLPTGSAFPFTFTEAGSYPYFCAIHPGMQATITVEG